MSSQNKKEFLQKKTSLRHILITLVAIFLVAMFILFFPQTKRLAEVTFKSLDGQLITSNSTQGKVLLVNFWATNCEPCLKEIPDLVSLEQRYRDSGLEVWAIAMLYDNPGEVVRFKNRFNIKFPVAFDADGSLGDRIGPVTVTPTTYLFDRNGKQVWEKLGPIDITTLQPQLESLLKK